MPLARAPVSSSLSSSLVLLLVATLSTQSACKSAVASPSDPLVVHEWGTFTSFQGADGASVEGLQHETEALPSFVHSRLAAKTSPLAVYGDPSRDVPVHHCRGKMETPVIYFHTSTPRHVKVDVSYSGLLTQWYPAASKATPAYSGKEEHDLRAVASSSLSWELDLVPSSAPSALAPKVASDSDWQKAREVNAAWVQSTGTRERETEQYVFYRGLMRTVPQPEVVPGDNPNQVTVTNKSGAELHAGFLLDMPLAAGGIARLVPLGRIAPGARTASFASGEARQGSTSEIVAETARRMQSALEAEGLYADEARAMVRTWSEAWFSSGGTRLLYLVPRAETDAILPLAITPPPTQLVRVIVGRVEYLSVARRQEVARDVLTAGLAYPDPSSDQALARLATLGRFAEPATRAAASANPGDAGLQRAAGAVLEILKR